MLGILVLLHNLHVIDLNEQLFWGAGLIILGGIFLYFYNRTLPKKNMLIPGIFFITIGLFTSLDALFYVPEALIGTFVFWITGAIFISIYIDKNNRWWGIIPGGTFLILGVILALNALQLLTRGILWFIFFFGISLIFWFLFLIKDLENKLDWTIYPAFLITIFSFFILSIVTESRFSDILFPLSIIFCGTYFLIKNALYKNQKLVKSPEP